MIEVAVGILTDEQGRVLISRRSADVHQANCWEFPGGKLEKDESVQKALARELQEELGIQVQQSSPLMALEHHYPDRSVRLLVRRVTDWQGQAQGLEGQPLQWRFPHELADLTFPAADHPIITALQLPVYYLITGDDPKQPQQFLNKLEQALQQGIRLVQLRAKTLTASEYEQLAIAAYAVCQRYQARLLLNISLTQWSQLPSDGLHLTAHQLAKLAQRPALKAHQWLAASCHHAQELAQAQAIGVDFAVLSPVQPTATHPEAEPLGWNQFAALVAKAKMPIYGLGGLDRHHLAQAQEAGAQGIAAIRALWPIKSID